jgi:hypothetical protein
MAEICAYPFVMHISTRTPLFLAYEPAVHDMGVLGLRDICAVAPGFWFNYARSPDS